MELLLFNTKDAVGRGINIDGTAAEAWQSYIDIYENASAMAQQNAVQDLRNILYTDHTDFDLFITTLQKKFSNVNALGEKLTDEDFKLIILNALPQSWDSVVAGLYGNMNSAETISQLQSWYARISRNQPPKIGQNSIALYTTTPKQRTNSQLICTNPNYKHCGHTIKVCYWPGRGKKGQFPPGFGKRGDARDTVVGTRQGSSHQIPTANVGKAEEEDKQTFAFMTMGNSDIKVQLPLPPEIAMSSDSHKSYSCNKTTNQDQRSKGVQVGNDQTSGDPVIFHTKTESRLTLIDSSTSNHCFINKSMFSSYTPLVNPSQGLSAGEGSVFSIIGKGNVKF